MASTCFTMFTFSQQNNNFLDFYFKAGCDKYMFTKFKYSTTNCEIINGI